VDCEISAFICEYRHLTTNLRRRYTRSVSAQWTT